MLTPRRILKKGDSLSNGGTVSVSCRRCLTVLGDTDITTTKEEEFGDNDGDDEDNGPGLVRLYRHAVVVENRPDLGSAPISVWGRDPTLGAREGRSATTFVACGLVSSACTRHAFSFVLRPCCETSESGHGTSRPAILLRLLSWTSLVSAALLPVLKKCVPSNDAARVPAGSSTEETAPAIKIEDLVYSLRQVVKVAFSQASNQAVGTMGNGDHSNGTEIPTEVLLEYADFCAVATALETSASAFPRSLASLHNPAPGVSREDNEGMLLGWLPLPSDFDVKSSV